jgi:hypothetical protein
MAATAAVAVAATDRKVMGAPMSDSTRDRAVAVSSAVGDSLLRPLIDLMAVYADPLLRIRFRTLDSSVHWLLLTPDHGRDH